jgi:Polyketide cyclase / dehydrase and lipid transport
MSETRTVSVRISASPETVYEFAANPANLPKWAPGFVKSIANRGGQWVADTTMGEVTFAFAERNSFGVLDHGVTLPSGESFCNPMRVVANGLGSEVLFTLFRHPPMTEAEFERDATVVLGDLEKLKAVIEALC